MDKKELTKTYFNYKTLDQLKSDIKRYKVDITFEEKLEAIKKEVKIGNKKAGNSLAIHPMEGCDATLDGKPDELTLRRWLRFGVGGAKLIWGEATAVVPEGRANPRQLLMNDKNLKSFETMLNLTRSVHKEVYGTDNDLLVGLQLTHSGRHSHPNPMIAYHHPQVDTVTSADKTNKIPITEDYPVITDDYLEKLEDAYLEAAKNAANIGFDFIDIKQCHTYLLNELLGARTRDGKYGGSFENRTRFIRNVLTKINSEIGNDVILASRINAFDGVPYKKDPQTEIGLPIPYELPYKYSFGIDKDNPLKYDLTEVYSLIELLQSQNVKLLNVSMGSPYYNMHIGRPFDRPPVDGYYMPEHPLQGIDRHFKITESIQKKFPEMAVVGTGYSWLQKYFINAAESNLQRGRVSLVGVGRGAIAYPSFAKDALVNGELKKTKVCYSVGLCTALMRSKNNELGQYAAGCVPRDKVYTKIYQDSLGRKKK